MTWNYRYRLTSYLRSSLWIVPIAALIIEQVSAGIIHALDARLGWDGGGLGLEGARALANTVLTFVVLLKVLSANSSLSD